MSKRSSNNGGNGGAGQSAEMSEVRALEAGYRQLESDILLARATFARQHGITFDGARDEYATFGYDRSISNAQYRAEYTRGGLAGRIIDVMPDACWRGDPPMRLIDDEDPQKDTTFEQAWTALDAKHQICAKLLRVDKLSRLSTFATLLIGAPGDLATELPKASGKGLLFLRPCSGGGGPDPGPSLRSTHATLSDIGTCAIKEYDRNPQSERFGLPASYNLRWDEATTRTIREVHWSRIVHIAEGLLDDEVYGQPALERIWNLLIDLRKITGGGSEAFWLRANQGMHLDIDKDMTLADATASVAALKEQAEAYKHQLTRWLRTRGVKVETLGSDVANFSQNADAVITQIAGAKGIPKRILTGSEMGELASSQDRENFKDIINGRQMQHCGPNIARNLADRLIAYGYLPEPAGGEYKVDWSHIQVMTESEKADGAGKWMAANQAAKNAGLQPIFTEAETRDHWYGYAPMTEEQLAAFEEAKRRAMKLAQELAPPAPEGEAEGDRNLEDHEEIVRVLAEAIKAGNTEVVHKIVGLP